MCMHFSWNTKVPSQQVCKDLTVFTKWYVRIKNIVVNHAFGLSCVKMYSIVWFGTSFALPLCRFMNTWPVCFAFITLRNFSHTNRNILQLTDCICSWRPIFYEIVVYNNISWRHNCTVILPLCFSRDTSNKPQNLPPAAGTTAENFWYDTVHTSVTYPIFLLTDCIWRWRLIFNEMVIYNNIYIRD
jgi:hypothetical protein